MGWLDRIAACNRHDLSRYRPFVVAGRRVGWIRGDRLPWLAGHPLTAGDRAVELDPSLDTPAARSEALVPLLRELAAAGEITRWRGESYPVAPGGPATPPLLEIERAAAPWFGIRACGVHINGVVDLDDGLHVWIGRRSADRPTHPGELDNTVAGGLPAGVGPRQCAINECAEEAGIPAELARRARPVGTVTYVLETELGIKPDTIYCFDLVLPPDFEPVPVDGEMAEYHLMPVGDLARRLRETADFKFNCALVALDLLVRHGVIGPEDPDYLAVCAGLHADLDAIEAR